MNMSEGSTDSTGIKTSESENQVQNLIATFTAISDMTKMKAKIEHYKFSVRKSSNGPLIDFELRGEMLNKQTEKSVIVSQEPGP